MKFVIFVCLYGAGIASAFYTDIDETTLKGYINKPEELHNFMECFVDKMPCDDQQMKFKNHINDALSNTCENCSPTLKHIVEQLIKIAVVKYPGDLLEIKNKFDPQGTNYDKLMANLAQY